MNGEIDPYVPPTVDPTSPSWESKREGERWRLEGGKLLVRDGAVLPGVCILSGKEGRPGFRCVMIYLQDGRIRITAFQTRRAYLGRGIRVFSGAVLGTAAGVTSSFLMVGDGSATSSSVSVSLILMGIGGLFSILEASRGSSVRPASGGWFELAGIHPAAITCLAEIQQRAAPAHRPA